MPLDAFELPIEIGIVAKSHAEADIQNTSVRLGEHLRSRPHADLVDVMRHGGARRAAEKSAERCLVHVELARNQVEIKIFVVVGFKKSANRFNASLVFHPAIER